MQIGMEFSLVVRFSSAVKSNIMHALLMVNTLIFVVAITVEIVYSENCGGRGGGR